MCYQRRENWYHLVVMTEGASGLVGRGVRRGTARRPPRRTRRARRPGATRTQRCAPAQGQNLTYYGFYLFFIA